MYSRILQSIEKVMLVVAFIMMGAVCVTGAILGTLCFAIVLNEAIQYVF